MGQLVSALAYQNSLRYSMSVPMECSNTLTAKQYFDLQARLAPA